MEDISHSELEIDSSFVIQDSSFNMQNSTFAYVDTDIDAGIKHLRIELQKYHWSGKIVRMPKCPDWGESSTDLRQKILGGV